MREITVPSTGTRDLTSNIIHELDIYCITERELKDRIMNHLSCIYKYYNYFHRY